MISPIIIINRNLWNDYLTPRIIFDELGFLGTDPTLHTATVANVRSVNYQDTDKELAKLNATIKEYLSKG